MTCVVVQTKYGPVRVSGTRSGKITQRDIDAIEAIAECLARNKWRGGDPDCHHENDGEGTCLGCGAQS
jgi:hypothetical protein